MPFSTTNGLAVNPHRGWRNLEDKSLLSSRKREPERKIQVHVSGFNPERENLTIAQVMGVEDVDAGETTAVNEPPPEAKSISNADALAIASAPAKERLDTAIPSFDNIAKPATDARKSK